MINSATTSLTNTPVTDLLQSPSPPTPPSPDGVAFYPGLKLPQHRHQQQRKPLASSKPGRRPAGASLSRTADGRIAKHGSSSAVTPATTTTTTTTGAAAAAAAAAYYSCPPAGDDGCEEDPEVVSRRYRNNLAAKRYRQKKIDRIQELEDEVKGVKEERDGLRLRVARQEAEIAALREMLQMRHGRSGSDGS